MPAPIGIRYYNLLNAGVGIIIWPELRSVSNNPGVLWDGRGVGGYKLYINENVTVDLANTGISANTQFYLGEDTALGTDMWDSSQAFFYDPNSNVTAFATRYGGADNGSLQYSGTKSEKAELKWPGGEGMAVPLSAEFGAYANAVAHDKVQELLGMAFRDGDVLPEPWVGKVQWLKGTKAAVIAEGDITIAGSLMKSAYKVTFETKQQPDDTYITAFFFGPAVKEDTNGSVPPKVEADWNAAVAKATKDGNPINEGVIDNIKE